MAAAWSSPAAAGFSAAVSLSCVDGAGAAPQEVAEVRALVREAREAGVAVNLGFLTSIEAGPGITYFTLMVVFTMFAAESFDPRLLWDSEKYE